MRLVLAMPAKLPVNPYQYRRYGFNSKPDRHYRCGSLTFMRAAAPKSGDHRTARYRTSSVITLGLIRAARQYSLNHNIQFSYFLITAQLARILRRVGMEIKSVGPLVHHRGPRRPYVHDFKNGYRTMRDKSPSVYEMFQVSPAYKYYSKTHVRRLPANYLPMSRAIQAGEITENDDQLARPSLSAPPASRTMA